MYPSLLSTGRGQLLLLSEPQHPRQCTDDTGNRSARRSDSCPRRTLPKALGPTGPNILPIASSSPRLPRRGLSTRGPDHSTRFKPASASRCPHEKKPQLLPSRGRKMKPCPIGTLLNELSPSSAPHLTLHPDHSRLHLLPAQCHSTPSSRKPSLICPSLRPVCASWIPMVLSPPQTGNPS